ncbi:MAG: succinate dehydrogenase [Campylobacteraceae bacterium 4484_4]|nr:MAG: succinate dehydrogenase [Campylobacteraceae bacterium 4484_4]
MKIVIRRFCRHREPDSIDVEYEIPLKHITLLEALSYIKTKIDPTLTFSSGCRSEICGSCAMRVNGREVLACNYKVREGDTITPLEKMPVLKDLVVDHEKPLQTLKRVKAWLEYPVEKAQSIEEEKRIERQSDCILCASCYSVCPVLEVDGEFLGPFALTRAYRYVSDTRCSQEKEKIDAIQPKGVWDCTLCGECTTVCPQGIDPKNDILMLRTKSVQHGYSDPNFAGGGFDDFGFNPSF